MKLENIINELQEYCFIEKKEDNQDKDIFKNYQIEFLDGFIGIICNQYNNIDKYEVYLNIKNTSEIACPLLYKTFKNVLDANNYYEELKNLIDNNDEKYIINRCKIGI